MEVLNSTTFIKKPVPRTEEEAAISEAKELLTNRLFLGYYEERRLVSPLKDYRDVVIISPAETELLQEVDKVRQSLIKHCNAQWIGITGSGSEGTTCSLWVKLSNVPFGKFWFQIKQIRCENGEILLRLKCIRPYRAQDYESTNKEESASGEKHCSAKPSEYKFEFDPAQRLATLYGNINEVVLQVRPHLTWKNVVLLFKFIFAIVIILVSAFITCVAHLGDYILKLIREFTMVLHAVTPIALHVIDCFSKIIGGIFILLALIFKGRPPGGRGTQNPFNLNMPNKIPSVPQIKEDDQSESIVKNSSSAIVPLNWRERNRNLKMQFINKNPSFM